MEALPPAGADEAKKEEDDLEFHDLALKVDKLKGYIKEEQRPHQQFYKGILLVTYLGVFFVVALLIPTAIGWFLDMRFNTRPILTLVGIVLGVAAGASGCYKMLKAYWERL